MHSSQGDIAIIGMSCIFPGAPDPETFWQNIVSKVDCVTEAPAGLGFDELFDPESTANDRIYCKRGGFLKELARFNPLEFGILPRALEGGDPDHFLALRVAHEALKDAGYAEKTMDRKRVEVSIGKATYVTRASGIVLHHSMVVDQTLEILKQIHPDYSQEELLEIKDELKSNLPPFNADTIQAVIPNLLSSRIANRLDLMGPNYVLDAACASSLIALEHGVKDLLLDRCDMAIVGGVNGYIPPHVLLIFCQIAALSRKGGIRPFDKDADGTLLGEGVGMVVLKRLADAQRDDDRIYAVIKGVGTASDGKAMGLLAPRVEGEELALQRAYEMAQLAPETVGLIEAHGTGTPVGDVVELQALTRVFGSRSGLPSTALGSVKSMISHGVPSAGVAGLIKTVLALRHKILPPTLHCDEPNPELEIEKTPFYINTETRPWIHGGENPRRAGVSAFGFGGINAHVVLEEYTDREDGEENNYHHRWDTEVLILHGESRKDLLQSGKELRRFLEAERSVALKDLAYTLNCPSIESHRYRLAIVAKDREDLEKKLVFSIERLEDSACSSIQDRSGIFFFEKPLNGEGTLAFLFPGEGSQYPNMLLELCLHFPEARACFDRADRIFLEDGIFPLPSQIIFPPPLDEAASQSSSEEAMWQIHLAVTAACSADLAMHTLLDRLSLKPRILAGHSYGDFCALIAAGAVPLEQEGQLARYLRRLNRIYHIVEKEIPEAKLLTVGGADPKIIEAVLREGDGAVEVAMDNCPNQIILCGSEEAVAGAFKTLQENGAICAYLPFQRAYHTSSYQPICDQFAQFFEDVTIAPPHTTVYSAATASPYPSDPEKIRELAVEQWVRPVRFQETIRAMYDEGVRIFVEAGPRSNLTGFVGDILGNERYLAVPSNVPFRSSLTQLNHLVGILAAHGVPMKLDYLYDRRAPQRLSIEKPSQPPEREKERDSSLKLDYRFAKLQLTSSVPKISSAQPRREQGIPQDRPDQQRSDPPPEPAARNKISKGLAEDSRFPEASTIEKDHASMQANLGSIPSHPKNVSPEAMQEYLKTMERFLDLQHGVIDAFLKRSGSSSSGDPASEGNLAPGENQDTGEQNQET